MTDIYAPAELNRVVDDLRQSKRVPFLLSRFFPEVVVSTTEEIFFDVLDDKPRLAPFCSPLVEGQIVQSRGYHTSSFKPAYVKDKRVFEDGKPVRRRAGQPIVAPLNPLQTRQLNVKRESDDQLGMLQWRLEWMAAQELLTGGVTISGDKYPTTVVDFGRDASLNVTLAGTARWNDSAPAPLNNLETWAGLVRDKSGASPVDVVMAENVWTVFRKNDDLRDELNPLIRGQSSDLDVGPSAPPVFGVFKGNVGDFNIWVYNAEYVDDAGAAQKFIPDGRLILASAAELNGVQHFGAIKDEAAGLQAREYFSKSWSKPDPAVRYLMLQSAPLVVPYRVNASLSATVL